MKSNIKIKPNSAAIKMENHENTTAAYSASEGFFSHFFFSSLIFGVKNLKASLCGLRSFGSFLGVVRFVVESVDVVF